MYGVSLEFCTFDFPLNNSFNWSPNPFATDPVYYKMASDLCGQKRKGLFGSHSSYTLNKSHDKQQTCTRVMSFILFISGYIINSQIPNCFGPERNQIGYRCHQGAPAGWKQGQTQSIGSKANLQSLKLQKPSGSEIIH